MHFWQDYEPDLSQMNFHHIFGKQILLKLCLMFRKAWTGPQWGPIGGPWAPKRPLFGPKMPSWASRRSQFSPYGPNLVQIPPNGLSDLESLVICIFFLILGLFFWCDITQIWGGSLRENPLLCIPYFGQKWPFLAPGAQFWPKMSKT